MKQRQTARRLDGWMIRGVSVFLAVYPSSRLASQDASQLTLRLAGWTAISGLEQAAGDSLLALLPGAARDRTGDVTLTLGRGAPKRLATCQLDEPGYVVGNI